MRIVPTLFAIVSALALAGCSGGSSGSSADLRIRCLGGQAFCIISCDLGCSQTGCSVTEIAENQRLRFKFSDAVDPATVTRSSISIRTPGGVAPAGDFTVSGSEVVFEPRVSTTNGVSSFGFKRNESYIIALAGGNSIAQSVKSVAGDGLSSEFSCTVVASLGVLDADQAPPRAELISPTVTSGAPVNPTVVLRFSELIDTTPLQASLSGASPIRIDLRSVLPSGECNTQTEGIPLTGVPQLSTEQVGQREVTVVTWQPEVQLPGNSCITVRVTGDLRDLSGRAAEPARFVFTTEAGVSNPILITEPFTNSAKQEQAVSGGTWGGAAGAGARAGLIGGDGRHGSFDPSLGNLVATGVYEWDTTNFLIPAGSSLTGQQYEVTNGEFYFTDMVVPEGTTIRFTGPNMPIIRVRGRVDIQGTIDISGRDLPGTVQNGTLGSGRIISTFNARGLPTSTVVTGQPGTAGGPGAGSGGNGGNECTNNGPQIVGGVNLTNGQPGADVSVAAGHAYAGSTAGTGGAGSILTPATGMWPTSGPPLVPSGLGIYCAYFSPGGAGGGFNGPGSQAVTPVHIDPNAIIVSEPIVPAGSAFNLQPFPPTNPPANYSSLDHFLVAGSGGGGGGSHGYGLIGLGANPAEKWMAGHGGTGGGGALAIRCGGNLTVGATGQLIGRGGDGVLIQGDDPAGTTVLDAYGISSPGGGGSGGSFLLQSARVVSFAGTLTTRGGNGCVVGEIAGTQRDMDGAAGDGANGFFRVEGGLDVTFSGSSVPAYSAGTNRGPLEDRDARSGDTSLWYSTGLIFPPTWERYELDVDTDGDGIVDVTYTDSGEPNTMRAWEPNGPTTLPLQLEFQGAEIDPLTNTPIEGTVGEWQAGIGSGAGPGINLTPVTGFRFSIIYNRSGFEDAVVVALRVYART